MLCSHRLPYERRCPFCFEDAMAVERLRMACLKEAAPLRSGLGSNDESMRPRNNRHSVSDRRRMALRQNTTASSCPDRRRAGGPDRQLGF
jgi:hypothetical protein